MIIYVCLKSKLYGFIFALFSGIAKPLSAVLAYAFFRNLITPLFLNGLVLFIAGIMLFVSAFELIFESYSYNHGNLAGFGICNGVLAMQIAVFLV